MNWKSIVDFLDLIGPSGAIILGLFTVSSLFIWIGRKTIRRHKKPLWWTTRDYRKIERKIRLGKIAIIFGWSGIAGSITLLLKIWR